MRLCWHLGTLGTTVASSEIQTSVAIFTACLNVYIISCESQALLATAIIILLLPLPLLSHILSLLYLYCSFCLFYLYTPFFFFPVSKYIPCTWLIINPSNTTLKSHSCIYILQISVTKRTRINGVLLSFLMCHA